MTTFVPIRTRFEDKYIVCMSGCWVWIGATCPDGYGRFQADKVRYTAYRFSYILNVGPIPDGLEIDHLCRVPLCVNWRHLEPVTHAENIRRAHGTNAQRLAARTHCKNGHEFKGLLRSDGGGRRCSQCDHDKHYRWLADPANRAKKNAIAKRGKLRKRNLRVYAISEIAAEVVE